MDTAQTLGDTTCPAPATANTVATILFDLLDKPLDYLIPLHLIDRVKKSVLVKANLNRKATTGFCFEVKNHSSFPHLQPIEEVLSDPLPPDLWELAVWMSRYYVTPLAKVLRTMMGAATGGVMAPSLHYFVERGQTKAALRKQITEMRTTATLHAQIGVLETMLNVKKGIFLSDLMEQAEVSRSPIDSLIQKGLLQLTKMNRSLDNFFAEEYFKTKKKELKPEQKLALEAIVSALQANRFETELLLGVTGSGKTEVYLQAMEETLRLGKTALILVPEISLTPQTIERFQARFDVNIAVIHSQLSDRARAAVWQQITSQQAPIVIGARSALFAPLVNLGLIIIDEEHDSAYKQTEKMPCYRARDVAVMRGKMNNAVVVLGSASPSLESYCNAKRGKYRLLELKERAESFSLPKMTLVDMRREFEKRKGFTVFSDALIEGVKQRYKRGEQVILFLNRRGYHTTIFCLSCGYIFKCPRCDLTLTYHQTSGSLNCHLCDYAIEDPACCISCKKAQTLKYRGIGTESVEKALQSLIQGVRTLRIDHDTTRSKGRFEQLYREFRTGKADVLIGTQMIAKGLHFPLVTLVGILNCDGALHIPDFRSSENVYQLIVQVAGRSGRNLEGEVILQTQMPDNPLIQCACRVDFENFYQHEIASRQFFGFPPLSHLIKCLFSGKNATVVEQYGLNIHRQLKTALQGLALLHPLLAAGHPKINERYRFQFLIQTNAIVKTLDRLQQELKKLSSSANVHLLIDVDPLFTFF